VNLMKNFIIFIACATSGMPTISAEINLICDVKSTRTFSTGAVEKDSGNALVEVVDASNFRAIFITSSDEIANNFSVTNKQDDRRTVNDFSTAARWDIENNIRRPDGTSVTRIVIDRNSGILIANRDFERNGRITTSNVSGVCRKNDAPSKKF
jgi:hypothetical protein